VLALACAASDLDAAEWRIQAPVMKMRTPHIVPLAPQAVDSIRIVTCNLDDLRQLYAAAPPLERGTRPDEPGAVASIGQSAQASAAPPARL